MNERIKELLEEASEVHDDWKTGQSQRLVDHKMFAELIIQECCAYLNGAMEVHNQREQDLMDLAARKIKEYFGVK